MRCRAATVLVVAAMLVVIPAKAADVQAWSAAEGRLPLSDGDDRNGLPDHARAVTEARFGGPREGLGFLLVRAGPMWEIHPNLGVNLNAVQAISSRDTGSLRPETRIELEPNVRGTLGPLHVNLRQRVDFRWVAAEYSPRYRAQIRFNYEPKSWRVIPFTSHEAHVITRVRLSEYRAVVGLSWHASKHVRLDCAYMWRPQRVEGSTFAFTHALVLTVTLTPKILPLFESGAG